MVNHFIHEIAVVADYDDAARKILKIFLENLQRHYVEVVGRLVEYEEVGILHQYCAQIELSTLTTAQLIYIIILLFGSEEEILQQLGCREFPATSQIHIVGNGSDDVNHFLLFVELQSLLREIAEAHGFAHHDTSLVNGHLSQQHLDKRRFARAVIAHNTHFLESREIVVEVVEDCNAPLESLRDILALENLGTDIHIAGFQSQLPFLDALLCHALQFIESFLAIAGLMASGLWHASHPFQFGAI